MSERVVSDLSIISYPGAAVLFRGVFTQRVAYAWDILHAVWTLPVTSFSGIAVPSKCAVAVFVAVSYRVFGVFFLSGCSISVTLSPLNKN